MCGSCCVQATATNAIDNARNNRVATCIRPIASNNASSDTSFVTAAHPSTGGIAPAAPPMTMFYGVGLAGAAHHSIADERRERQQHRQRIDEAEQQPQSHRADGRRANTNVCVVVISPRDSVPRVRQVILCRAMVTICKPAFRFASLICCGDST